MESKYQPVIGLEVHAVLETKSKMFCDCKLVDSTHGQPNSAVCPVCSGMPGVLPVTNRGAVAFALKVALALKCEISLTSIFARKSYFYPDLPKGYQISQFDFPLARNGKLTIQTSEGEKTIRIRRVHIEEDTGKLTHINEGGKKHSLVDLNRSGIPLLEIVTEPDLHSVEAVKEYAHSLRTILRYLEVNSGNLEKGLFRIEPNISIREVGSKTLGTRTEIKNLNSFRSLERGVAFEIERQSVLLDAGKKVKQQTLGWNESLQETVPQRSKEDAEDYRYFPEPDLPPLVLEQAWVDEIRAALPELHYEKVDRFINQIGLSPYDAKVLAASKNIANFYERVIEIAKEVKPKVISNWITGDLFGWLNQNQKSFSDISLSAENFGELLSFIETGIINQNTAKTVLTEMLSTNKDAKSIVKEKGLAQVSDVDKIEAMIDEVLANNNQQLQSYLSGKNSLENWFFGQIMKIAKGQGNPKIIKEKLTIKLQKLKDNE
jgi:aspartyl-tRNA(Asn)/glutamyl-tRNA(Gln) amidotransferase subunit B